MPAVLGTKMMMLFAMCPVGHGKCREESLLGDALTMDMSVDFPSHQVHRKGAKQRPARVQLVDLEDLEAEKWLHRGEGALIVWFQVQTS